MTKVVVLPHAELLPQGATLEAAPGTRLVDVLLENGIDIEHACGKVCACTTCHVHIRKGGPSVNEPIGMEEDLLDMAWGLDMDSRLSCQVFVGEDDLVVEIPKYTINLAKEG